MNIPTLPYVPGWSYLASRALVPAEEMVPEERAQETIAVHRANFVRVAALKVGHAPGPGSVAVFELPERPSTNERDFLFVWHPSECVMLGGPEDGMTLAAAPEPRSLGPRREIVIATPVQLLPYVMGEAGPQLPSVVCKTGQSLYRLDGLDYANDRWAYRYAG